MGYAVARRTPFKLGVRRINIPALLQNKMSIKKAKHMVNEHEKRV
jgi:hypothetical protein